MRLFQLNVTKTRANSGAPVKIPKGIIGAKVALWFSPEWEGLTKTVVFRAGEATKDVLDVQDDVIIPVECTQEVGALLEIGVYGVDAENTVAIPTLWAVLGTVYDGADPSGDPSTDPQLPVWAQLLKMYEELQDEAITEEQAQDLIDKAVTELPAHNGASAYEIAVEHGFEGTEEEWLESLKGEPGTPGQRGDKGEKGDKGDRGEQGVQGVAGAKGETGAKGDRGEDGIPATHRWSGTTLYVTSASGTTSANLKGDKGDTGATGKDGKDGSNGQNGVDGRTPVAGIDYFTEAEKTEMVNEVLEAIPSDGVYGNVPIFEITTEEAVSYVIFDTKADGTKIKLKAALVLAETAEAGTSSLIISARSNSKELAALYASKPAVGAATYAEFYNARGLWKMLWGSLGTNKTAGVTLNTSYASVLNRVETYPAIDWIKVQNVPANTKIVIYGVEENA